MELSARNQLQGTVRSVKLGTIMSEVAVDVGGQEIVAAITRSSTERLGLQEGSTVTVVEGTTTLGSALVGSNGQWSLPVQLGFGAHTLAASETLAGETSPSSPPFVVIVRANPTLSTQASGGAPTDGSWKVKTAMPTPVQSAGSGVIGGIGLGLGYISPVSTLVKWFPDRRGMATGLAIMGFGGGAMIGAPLADRLMKLFEGFVPMIAPPVVCVLW